MYQVASLVASPFVFIEIIISITIGLCLCYYSSLISSLVPLLVLLFGQDIKITFFLGTIMILNIQFLHFDRYGQLRLYLPFVKAGTSLESQNMDLMNVNKHQ